MQREVHLPGVGPVCRLGLATRGNAAVDEPSAWLALERGVNYWNWCGHPDGLQHAIRNLGRRRSEVCVAVQFEARGYEEAKREFEAVCAQLNTDYIDVVTYYYVQRQDEWQEITDDRFGAHRHLVELKQAGAVRLIGLTTHNRRLGAEVARSGLLDLLMIRYNAAHRGAERDVFPVTRALGMPVIAFTVLRWGHLIRPVAGCRERPLRAVECYRYVLSHPDVAVALMAPGSRDELVENLTLLDNWWPMSPAERARVEAYGRLVYQKRRYFP